MLPVPDCRSQGLCILEVDSEDETRREVSLDPIVAAGLNGVDLRPVRVAMERSCASD
jgi:hypothetical protein